MAPAHGVVAIAAALALLAVVVPGARADPNGFQKQFLVPGKHIMDVEFLPDGRALVSERLGKIHIGSIEDVSKNPLQLYLNLEDVMDDSGEKGLMDVALDPDFAQNNYIYAFYCRNGKTGPGNAAKNRCRVSRFTHQGNSASINSEKVIFIDTSGGYGQWTDQFPYDHHYGAGLAFGPDGRLYLTTGDKAVPNEAQNLDTYHGCVVRVNKDGSFPSGNVGDPKDAPGCWVSGLRNGWRATWDLQTNRFFVGEVGGNVGKSTEDLHILSTNDGGTNLGWPFCEGHCDNPDFPKCSCAAHQDPAYTYSHDGSNACLLGGLVYRGQSFPSKYNGVYFFGDYSQGWLKYLEFHSDGTQVKAEKFFDFFSQPVGMQVGPHDGHLYVISLKDGIYRYVSTAQQTNRAPTFSYANARSVKGLKVNFEASASDPDGDSLSYAWNFGNGKTGKGAAKSHTYSSPGTYTVLVTVDDGEGHQVLSQPIEVSLGAPPQLKVKQPQDGMVFVGGQVVAIEASATDSAGKAIPTSGFSWDIRFKHDNHFHPIATGVEMQTGELPIPRRGHTYAGDTAFLLDVTVTDSFGVQTKETRTLLPDKTLAILRTNPCGLSIELDGIPVQASCGSNGYTEDSLSLFEHEVVPEAEACKDGVRYAFANWATSAGGAVLSEGAKTFLRVGAQGTTVFTAVYSKVGTCETGYQKTGLVLHLTGAGAQPTGNKVKHWADESGRDNHFGVVFKPPKLKQKVKDIANHPYVRFDGKNDAMGIDGPAMSGIPGGDAARSVFMVVRYQGSGWGGFTWGSDDVDCGNVFGLGVSPNDLFYVESFCAEPGFSNLAHTSEGWVIHEVRMAQGGTKLDHRIDDFRISFDGKLEQYPPNLINTGLDSMRMGVEHNGINFVRMSVAEVLVYSEYVADTARESIIQYLRDKYDL